MILFSEREKDNSVCLHTSVEARNIALVFLLVTLISLAGQKHHATNKYEKGEQECRSPIILTITSSGFQNPSPRKKASTSPVSQFRKYLSSPSSLIIFQHNTRKVSVSCFQFEEESSDDDEETPSQYIYLLSNILIHPWFIFKINFGSGSERGRRVDTAKASEVKLGKKEEKVDQSQKRGERKRHRSQSSEVPPKKRKVFYHS